MSLDQEAFEILSKPKAHRRNSSFNPIEQQKRLSICSISQADQEKMRKAQVLAMSPTGLPGIATPDERKYYYDLCKKGNGLSPKDRRGVWLQVTGAQGLLNASLTQHGADYMSLCENINEEYPTVNRHQIEVDMPRTFPDEAFFKSNKEKGKRPDTLQE